MGLLLVFVTQMLILSVEMILKELSLQFLDMKVLELLKVLVKELLLLKLVIMLSHYTFLNAENANSVFLEKLIYVLKSEQLKEKESCLMEPPDSLVKEKNYFITWELPLFLNTQFFLKFLLQRFQKMLLLKKFVFW